MTGNPQDRIKMLNRIGSDAFHNAMEIVELIEVIEAGNKAGITRHLRAKGAGRAALLVRNALLTRLHLYTARAYGQVRKGDLHLSSGFKLVKQPDVRAHIQSRGSLKQLAKAERLWMACNADPELPSFQHFRNKLLAHWSEPDQQIPLPTYATVFRVARSTAATMEMFAQASGVISLSLKSQMIVPKREIATFWKPWK